MTGEVSSTLSEDERSILDRLSYEPDRDDGYLLAVVDDDRRKAMFVRLDALADRIQGRLDVQAASAKAGVSVPTFYRLMKAWTGRKGGGLRSVAGVAGRPPRGTAKDRDREIAVERAAALLDSELFADLPVKTLARLVRKAADDAISVTAAETIVRDMRLQRSRSAAERDRAFGRELLLDACAVSMVSSDPDDMASRLVIVAMLMEVSTGLMLAAVAASEDSAVRAQGAAVRRGIASVNRLGIDVVRAEPTRLTVTVGPAMDPLYDRFVGILERSIGAGNVRASGPRRFGRQTIAVIGRSLDRLLLLPASTEGGSVDAADARSVGRIPLPSDQVQIILRRSVERHNEPILEQLRTRSARGVFAKDGAEGCIRKALERALPVSSAVLRGETPASNR